MNSIDGKTSLEDAIFGLGASILGGLLSGLGGELGQHAGREVGKYLSGDRG